MRNVIPALALVLVAALLVVVLAEVRGIREVLPEPTPVFRPLPTLAGVWPWPSLPTLAPCPPQYVRGGLAGLDCVPRPTPSPTWCPSGTVESRPGQSEWPFCIEWPPTPAVRP